ncbi:MAG: M4 family metallopeptidase [Bacteroidota bacterium]
MKKLFIFVLLILCGINYIFSQIYEGTNAEKYIPGSQIVRFSGNNENPSYIKLNPSFQPNLYEINTWLNRTFNTGDYFGINLLRKESDEMGYEHYRYQQTYKNIPIREAIFLVHVKSGKIESFNGTIFSNPIINNSIIYTENSARINAISSIHAASYMWQNSDNEQWLKQFTGKADATYFPSASKQIVYNVKDRSFRIVFAYDIYAEKPLSRQNVYVDAENGKIIKTLNTLYTNDAHGNAVTKYSGTQPITTDSVSPTVFHLHETGRGNGIQTMNMQTSTNYGSAVDFVDTDNYWNNVNTQMDNAAADAHWGAEMTYDYYFTQHARNSIDGNGFALFSYVHYDVAFDNAFWDGQKMTYGDGSNNNPFVALDICGHEITHGLDSYTANLDYAAESGAMNEGYSDIFGTAIEFYAKPTQANWTCGENIGFIIRDLQNPSATQNPDTYLGTYWDLAQEVHQNSTVISYWFYLTSQGGSGTNDIGNAYSVTGIGITKAAKVAFRTLTVYLTSTSDYADSRFYSIVSAADIYGGCNPEVQAVTNAMYAVGLGSAYVPSVTIDFSATNTQACSTPSNIQFTNLSTNATNYTWSFGDGTFSTLANPSHTYSSLGNFNVKLKGQSSGCGSDSLTKNAFISIASTNSNYANMPVSGVGQALTCCSGTLFDSGENGDYSNNTDGTITIAPVGASDVVLTFSSFNFESGYDYLYIYDGPNSSSTLIGQFDGTNLPSGGMIQSSTGSITLRQVTDPGVTASGFALTWQCSLPSTPPVSNFYASEISTCTGMVHFHDMSTNGPVSWLWKFGDGGMSTLQNPTHGYVSNGMYTVTLKTTNAFGNDSLIKTSYIEVTNLPSIPSVTPGSACVPNTVSLSASGSGQLNWYDAVTDGNLLFTGSNYVTPMLYNTTTYYVEDKIASPSQYVGKVDNSGSGGNYNSASNVHYEIFNCYSPVRLLNVKVYASGAGNRTIQLRDSNLVVLQSKTVAIPDGESIVFLDFPIPIQSSLQLACTGTPDLYRNNNSSASYPYLLAGLIKITESSASKPPYNVNGNYYYFYDWEVKETECASPRVPVVATINDCSGINENNGYSNFSVYPNPATEKLFVEFTSSFPQNFAITLHDVIGKMVYSESYFSTIGLNQRQINLKDVKPGVYFIKVEGNSWTRMEKVVVK